MLMTGTISAQERNTILSQDRTTISLEGVYGYNKTWENHGGVDLNLNVPILKYFEIGAAMEYLSPKVFSATAILRPQIQVEKGNFFIDCTFQFHGYDAYKTNEYVFAGAAGYKRPYFKVMLGAFGRTMQDRGQGGECINEAVNVLYHASFTVRAESSKWNVGAAVANFSQYEFERMWYPVFFINGHYDFMEHMGLIAEVQCKTAGMFHMANTFYGITVRAGLKFTL